LDTSRYIDVGRRLLPQREGTKGAGTHSWSGWESRGHTWEELFERAPIVIALGEAGSGKTVELQALARNLQRGGRPSFYATIHDVAVLGLETAVGGAAFRAWRAGGASATFLLDSVDEARLYGPLLKTALRRIGAELEDDWARVRFVLSSRGSDWNEHVDGQLVSRYLTPGATERGDAGAGFELSEARAERISEHQLLVARFAPLSIDQSSAMLSGWEVEEPVRLLSDLRAIGATDFATRPLDLRWLVETWEGPGSFGSFKNVVERSVQLRLSEEDPQRHKTSSVSAAGLRGHAEQLAAGMTMTGSSSLRRSEWSAAHDKKTATVAALLPAVPRPELEALLSSGLFDPETFGRVRFHHRSVREYLAAGWFAALLKAGVDPQSVLDTVVASKYGRLVVPAHLEGVLAWLAPVHSRLFKVTSQVAPELLIGAGDPAQMSVQQGTALLSAFVDRYLHRQDWPHRFDWGALKRFGTQVPAEAVAASLEAAKGSEYVAGVLLQLIQAAEVGAAAVTVVDLALDRSVPKRTRRHAIRVAREVCESDQLARLSQVLSTGDELPELRAEAARALFPKHLAAPDFVSIVANAEGTRAPQRLAEYSRVLRSHDQSTTESLLAALSDHPSNETRLFFLEAQAVLLLALFEAEGRRGFQRPAPRRALGDIGTAMSRHFRPDSGGGIAFGRLTRLAEARREIFWLMVESAQGKPAWSLRALANDQIPFWPNNDDFEWLAEDAQSGSELRLRLLALDGALQVGTSTELEELELSFGKTTPEWRRCHRFRERTLHPWRNPRQDRLRAARGLRLSRQREREATILADCLPALRSGEDFHNLRVLYGRLQRRVDGPDNWGLADWKQLEPEHGRDVAQAFREGCLSLAASVVPELPPPGRSRSVPMANILALCGMAIRYEESGEAEILAERVQPLATLALWEMNKLPEWFVPLLRAYPEPVSAAIRTIIRADLEAEPAETGTWTLLQRLHLEAEPVRLAAVPALRAWLEGKPPDGAQTDTCLRLLFRPDEEIPKWLAEVAADRVQGMSLTEESFVSWWTYWLNTEPVLALEYLSGVVADGGAEGVHLLTRVANSPLVSVEELPVVAHEALTRILLGIDGEALGRNFVSGEVWQHDWRDELRRFRQALPERLAARGGSEAHDALLRLAAGSALSAWERDYLAHLANRAASRDAADAPWSPARFLEFGAAGEFTPANGLQLFQMVGGRLDRIRRELRGGDLSLRVLFHPETPELGYQLWLGNRLDALTGGRYHLVREPEVFGGKKPDVLVGVTGIRAQVPIEVKPAHRYSIRQLEESIQDQLIGRYLRDPNRDYGCFVLCNAQPGRRWLLPNEEELGFNGLVKHLQAHTAGVVRTSVLAEEVTVVGLDFTG